MGNLPTEQGKEPAATHAQAAQANPGNPGEQEFAETQQQFAATQIGEDPEISNDWWSESTDGQCSENAALFAASQPAPLSIV